MATPSRSPDGRRGHNPVVNQQVEAVTGLVSERYKTIVQGTPTALPQGFDHQLKVAIKERTALARFDATSSLINKEVSDVIEQSLDLEGNSYLDRVLDDVKRALAGNCPNEGYKMIVNFSIDHVRVLQQETRKRLSLERMDKLVEEVKLALAGENPETGSRVSGTREEVGADIEELLNYSKRMFDSWYDPVYEEYQVLSQVLPAGGVIKKELAEDRKTHIPQEGEEPRQREWDQHSEIVGFVLNCIRKAQKRVMDPGRRSSPDRRSPERCPSPPCPTPCDQSEHPYERINYVCELSRRICEGLCAGFYDETMEEVKCKPTLLGRITDALWDFSREAEFSYLRGRGDGCFSLELKRRLIKRLIGPMACVATPLLVASHKGLPFVNYRPFVNDRTPTLSVEEILRINQFVHLHVHEAVMKLPDKLRQQLFPGQAPFPGQSDQLPHNPTPYLSPVGGDHHSTPGGEAEALPPYQVRHPI